MIAYLAPFCLVCKFSDLQHARMIAYLFSCINFIYSLKMVLCYDDRQMWPISAHIFPPDKQKRGADGEPSWGRSSAPFSKKLFWEILLIFQQPGALLIAKPIVGGEERDRTTPAMGWQPEMLYIVLMIAPRGWECPQADRS